MEGVKVDLLRSVSCNELKLLTKFVIDQNAEDKRIVNNFVGLRGLGLSDEVISFDVFCDEDGNVVVI